MSSLAARRAKAGASNHAALTATESLARMNERPRDIRLSDITLDLGLQFRLDVKGTGGIDEKHVLDLMHVIADGADTDPVILYRVDNALLMVDGFHRYEAYRRSERPTLPAIVRDGTYAEAEEAAENANLQFKKALNEESKKYIFARRVQREYQTNGISWQQLSDKAIAAELGVSYKTIDRWFEEIESGVTFVTPAGQEIAIQVSLERSVVYGRDGKQYEVQAIREANSKRAEEERKRKDQERLAAQVAAEAEKLTRWRASNVIFRAKFIADMILHTPSNRNTAGKLKIDLPPENTPEEHKTFGYYVKAADKRLTLTVDRESQFLRDFQSHKDYRWYQEVLAAITPALWEQADAQNWTEEDMQQWLNGFRRRQSVLPPSTAPQSTMAQPKNPDLAYQPPAATGRHRLTEVTPSQAEAPESTDPIDPAATGDDELKINTNPDPCPFKKDDVVVYMPSGTPCEVQDAKWDGYVWWMLVLDEQRHSFSDRVDQFEGVEVLLESVNGEDTFEADTLEGDGVDSLDEKMAHAEAPDRQVNLSVPSSSKRQAEMMVEDARSLLPRLLVNTSEACADFRHSTLVQWEAPKSLQTILEHGDGNEINLMERDLLHTRGEVGIVATLLNKMLNNIDAMLAEIEAARG